METILIVDDEPNIREGLARFAAAEGYGVEVAVDGQEALEKARTLEIDCALVDLRLPRVDGARVLSVLVSERPLLPVIIITGHGTVQNAVAAMRNGAYDFITKPVNLDRLGALITRALENRRALLHNQTLRTQLRAQDRERALASASPAMQRVVRVAEQVARTDATILVTGESGVGKEVLADLIHADSSRASAPMIKVHCAALSETLLESELFGHEKGAFTGATAQRKGRFELADRGTIFLDEIGEIDRALQVKILRVLQERKFERVGGERTIAVDVRIIAATNRDLQREIAAGRFREDLYYRLNVVQIEVPPLRDRREDLPRLLAQFLSEFGGATAQKHLSSDARRILMRYHWPGNIRELRNCIERAVILSEDALIDAVHLPAEILRADDDGVATDGAANSKADAAAATDGAANSKADAAAATDGDAAPGGAPTSLNIPTAFSLAEAERIIIRHALARNGGNKSKTAIQLGVRRATLYSKMEKYGLGDE